MAIAMSRPVRSTIASAQRTASLERKGKAVSVVVAPESSHLAPVVAEDRVARGSRCELLEGSPHERRHTGRERELCRQPSRFSCKGGTVRAAEHHDDCIIMHGHL